MILTIGNIYVIYCSWINPPHDKICLCICDARRWFFWFNTKPSFHNIGQFKIQANAHPAISHECFLDLSSIKTASAAEITNSVDRGPISPFLRDIIKAELSTPIKRLPEAHRLHALSVL